MTKPPTISDLLFEALRPSEPWEQMARLDKLVQDYASPPVPAPDNDNMPKGEEGL